jgi:hypothetical protein
VATTVTGCGGSYSFNNLAPGAYTLYEPGSQPALQGSKQGKATPGTVGSNTDGAFTSAGTISSIALGSGANGSNYNFGETASGQTLCIGDTGSSGFWTSTTGQTLINSLNGGSTATGMGNWLSATFPNLYGTTCGSNKLTGKSNTYIYNLMVSLNNGCNTQCAAQVLACAVNLYATNTSLCGNAAVNYGFNVSATGCGNKLFNVWTFGQAAGVSNYGTATVLQIVQYCNTQAYNSTLYGGNSTLQWEAFNIFEAINQAGGIGAAV